MRKPLSRDWVPSLLICFATLLLAPHSKAQQVCYTAQERARAEQTARVYRAPDPGYDPVLGYNPARGPRRGALPADANGVARPMKCVANKDVKPGAGTTPKFHCSVPGVTDEEGNLIRYKIKPHFKGQSTDKRNGEIYGEFLSSRFSKALGFFADDEWVADVNCPDCEKSLTKSYQGAKFTGFEPAAGIELSLARGIDVNCDGKDSGSLAESLQRISVAVSPALRATSGVRLRYTRRAGTAFFPRRGCLPSGVLFEGEGKRQAPVTGVCRRISRWHPRRK